MGRQDEVYYKVVDENGLVSICSGSTGAPSNKATRIQSKEFQTSQKIIALMSGNTEV